MGLSTDMCSMALAATSFPLPIFLSAAPLIARLFASVALPVKIIVFSFSPLMSSATFAKNGEMTDCHSRVRETALQILIPLDR